MIDILLLAGAALCALSVLMAVVAVARTQAPRAAAVVLVLGIVVMFAASWLDTRPFGLDALGESWQRLTGSQEAPATDPAPAQPSQ